jgi:hypothetical protein
MEETDLKLALSVAVLHESAGINHVKQPPALNRHLTKSRLNDAPHLCKMLHRNV